MSLSGFNKRYQALEGTGSRPGHNENIAATQAFRRVQALMSTGLDRGGASFVLAEASAIMDSRFRVWADDRERACAKIALIRTFKEFARQIAEGLDQLDIACAEELQLLQDQAKRRQELLMSQDSEASELEEAIQREREETEAKRLELSSILKQQQHLKEQADASKEGLEDN